MSGPSRAIKFLYAPTPPSPTVWALKPPAWALVHKTSYAPMNNTALCIMFWMRAYPLQGQVVGGWTLEIESFLGPVKWHRADRRAPFGAQRFNIWCKTFIHRLFGEKSLNFCAQICQKNFCCLAVGKYCSKRNVFTYTSIKLPSLWKPTYLTTLLSWSWMNIPIS